MDEDVKKMIKDATDGLERKNRDLLKENRAFKDQMAQFDGIDLKALKKQSEELKRLKDEKLEQDGEYKKMYDQQKLDHENAVKALRDEKEGVKNTLNDVLKTGALTKALAGNKVIPELIDVAVTSLKDKIALTDDFTPMVGDKDVNTFVQEWAKSDVGKHFVSNGNSGGGAGGSDGGIKDDAAKFFDKSGKEFNLTEQAKIASTDPTRYNSLKKQYS